MPTIKLSSSGKVILKDGKVHCQCCTPIGFCDYRNNWGPGYDELPDTVTIKTAAIDFRPDGRLHLPEQVMTLTRVSKCRWYAPPSCQFNMVDTNRLQFNTTSGWFATVTMCNTSFIDGMRNWITFFGHKGGAFTDGPQGTYVAQYGNLGTVI